MDIGLIRGLATLLLMSAFVALCLWAYSPRRRRQFEDAARLALDDDTTSDDVRRNHP